MALTMSEEAKNEYLNDMDSNFITKVWATMVKGSNTLLQYTDKKKLELINVYSYVGLTDKNLDIVLLSSLNVTQPTAKIQIPLEDIQDVKIKKKTFSYIVLFKIKDEIIQFNFSLVSVGTNIQNQRKNVEKLIESVAK